MEVWKPVVGLEGLYEVSDQGRVRSLDRIVWCEGPVKGRYPSRKPGRVLRPGRCTVGHMSVALSRKSFMVHALVLAAFVGPREKGLDTRHLNGIPADNRLSNLEYSSRTRNSQDKKWHNGASTYKLSGDQAREIILALDRGTAGSHLARKFGVAQSTISAIKHKKFHRDIFDSL